MSRNKENIPVLQSQRSNGSLRVSKHLPSEEFFTDSLLDATRLSSRIPTPSPQKPPLTKARRARTTKLTRNAQPIIHRSSASENLVPQLRKDNPSPATPQRNGAGVLKLRTHSVSTPPTANGDIRLASPYSSISSPPTQDITDAYQQIQDAEDLAQTDREVSSDDSNISEPDQAQPRRLHQRSYSESPVKASPLLNRLSPVPTPTRSTGRMAKNRRFAEQTETLSEASGLSFLKEITDRGLAEALTPHMSERAKDKARLEAIWAAKGVKAFSKAQVPRKEEPNVVPPIPAPKLTALSQAARYQPNGLPNWNGYQRQGNEPALQHFNDVESERSNDGTWAKTNHQPPKAPPMNARLERDFNFSTNFGFPAHRPALTEQNLEQQNRGTPIGNNNVRSLSSAPSLLSDQSLNNAKVLGDGMRMSNGQISRLPQFRRSARPESKVVVEETSQDDWAAATADVPVSSVEPSLAFDGKESTLASLSRLHSPEKNRRWENDFTGQSFQVSESPPVRQKPVLIEQQKDKEIEGVAKQAITTNRLSQIRERQSQESLRSVSNSTPPRSASRPVETRPPIDREESDLVGVCVPDTPVVIYRSSSNSGSDKASSAPPPPPPDRPSVDRSKSHDQLQRLARAMSTTPRSSPASGGGSKDSGVEPLPLAISRMGAAKSSPESVRETPLENPKPLLNLVAQTPKVVGAWTDTILPDTVRTVKQSEKTGAVAQTPHVSAGGWIDTPAPEVRKYSGNISTIIEEVPEELTSGIVKDTASGDNIKAHAPTNASATVQEQPQVIDQPKSTLALILDKQKNRQVSQDVAHATPEDTLNLGNDTIESLRGLLTLDDEDGDLTNLSRFSLNEDDSRPLVDIRTESELLQHISVKLNRLQNNVHDARKGISKLEHQVSQPVEPTIMSPSLQQLKDATCKICSQQPFQPHAHPSSDSRYLPYASLNLALPIPLLFKPRKPGQWLPRPTILGGITMAVWLWYLVESVMCELYGRPEYTDFYNWPTEPEPEFPLVLPTMLARWTRLSNLALGSAIVGIWNLFVRLIRAAWRVVGMMAGWSDGFAADVPLTPIVKNVVETITSAVAAATGVDMSMNDDEFL